MVTRPAPGMPASTRVTYDVKSPAELIKILQPLLAGQPRVEMKALANNSQLIVERPPGGAAGGDPRAGGARGTVGVPGVASGRWRPPKMSVPQMHIVAKFTNVDPAAARKNVAADSAPEEFELPGDLRLPGQIARRRNRPPEQNAPTNAEAPAATGQTAEKK